jgi:hypothetical protein
MRDRKSDRHRKVAAARAGRKLGPNEVVHHKDEDKSNDNPDNLVVESRSAHTVAHNKTRGLGRLRGALRMHREGRKLY